MSETFTGDAVCREFESEAPAAREMLDRVICSREQFSFQMCLESGDGSGTFCNWRLRVPDSWCRDTECFGLKVDPVYSIVYISLQINTLLCYTLISVLVFGIGIARGQYYWILGALLGTVLTLSAN